MPAGLLGALKEVGAWRRRSRRSLSVPAPARPRAASAIARVKAMGFGAWAELTPRRASRAFQRSVETA